MTQTPGALDYEREALNQLEAADNFRKILSVVYEEKPYDPAMIGALRAGITYSLKAAQTYATLATVQAQRATLRAVDPDYDGPWPPPPYAGVRQ